MAVNPLLQAIYLAHEVSQDNTGKLTVTRIFDQIEVEPGQDFTRQSYLFFTVRGVRGRTSLKLYYVDLQDNEVLLEKKLTLDGNDPLLGTTVCIPLPRLRVPHPGVYAWELFHESELLGSARVQVVVSAGRDS
jgi:hypothetical protein